LLVYFTMIRVLVLMQLPTLEKVTCTSILVKLQKK
jgi:hypothetical protein